MYWLGYLLAFLAAIAVGWVLPLVGVALVLPLLQVVFVLNPWVAAGLMGLLGGLLVYYSLTHQAYWQGIFWGALWGMGALTAVAGVFHWYALFLECVLVVLLIIPGIIVPTWVHLLRWYATGEIALTLLLIWGQGVGLPGTVLVMALLLIGLATLLGLGAYRPFEARRMRRRLAGLAAAAAVLLLLWQPVLIPAASWLGQIAQAAGQFISDSPLGRWYHIASLRVERREIGEAAKTAALQGLQGSLTEAHRRRWEKAVGQIPELPLSAGEWGDLGIPRDADP